MRDITSIAWQALCLLNLFLKVKSLFHINFKKSISAAKNASLKEDENTDPAFDEVIGKMLKDRSRWWNSIELYQQYQLFGGKALLRRSLLVEIQDHFLDDIAVLSSPGLSRLLDRMRRLYCISLETQ